MINNNSNIAERNYVEEFYSGKAVFSTERSHLHNIVVFEIQKKLRMH